MSEAAAIVAGGAALLLAWMADAGYDIQGRAVPLKRTLVATVDRVPALRGKCSSGGRLNVSAALLRLQQSH